MQFSAKVWLCLLSYGRVEYLQMVAMARRGTLVNAVEAMSSPEGKNLSIYIYNSY